MYIYKLTQEYVKVRKLGQDFKDFIWRGLRIHPQTINDLLKNKAQLVHSRHRSITNFLVNLVAVLGAYCFFENKPDALQGYYIENSKQLSLF